MNGLLKFGRILFAIAMLSFGVQFLILLTGFNGPTPGLPWTHNTRALDCLASLGFILAGVSILTGAKARFASVSLGAVLLLYALFLYGPGLLANLHNPSPWTAASEVTALAGGAFVAAKSFSRSERELTSPTMLPDSLAIFGRFVIAASLLVYAVQHLLYARLVGDVLPSWIPAHLLVAYFTSVAFVAVAISFVSGQAVPLAAGLLGALFLVWTLLVHVPRVAVAPRNGSEVTGLFVAMALSGLSFVLAGVEGNGAR